MQHELNVGREANSTLKEEYEILEERFRKATRMSEDQISELEKDLKKMAGKVKTLQDFYDKHDAILQEERNSSNAEIKQLRDEKDELTRKFTKELDEKTMALETLEGTQKVKMMQNKLLELEWVNKLTEIKEKEEDRQVELTQLHRDLNWYKINYPKQENNVKYLRGEKESLSAKVKQLEKIIEGGDEDEAEEKEEENSQASEKQSEAAQGD